MANPNLGETHALPLSPGVSRGTQWTVGLLLLAGIVLVVFGASRAQGLEIGWQPDGRTMALTAAAGTTVLAAFASWRRWAPGSVALLAGCILGVGGNGVGAVAATLLVLASSYQLGALVLGSGTRRSACVQIPVLVATGLAVIVGVLQLVSRAPVHVAVIYMCVLGTPFLVRNDTTRDAWRQLTEAFAERQWPRAPLDFVLALIAGIGLVVMLVAALAPEVAADALAMHLVMPTIVARDHGWWPLETGFVWAWMPMAADWVYAVGYVLADEAGARLLNYAAGALLVTLTGGLAAELAGRRAGLLAACILATLPFFFLTTTSLFVENLWALWVVAAIATMQGAAHAPSIERSCAVVGLLLGAALAAKLMTVFWAPLVLAWLWMVRTRLSPRAFALLVAGGLLIGAWPYVTAWMDTGNPLFPFYNDIFESPLGPQSRFESPYPGGLPPTLLYDLTFGTSRFLEASPGALGFAFLALLPAAAVAVFWSGTNWMRVLLVAALTVLVATFSFTAYARYIAPVYPLWALLIGAGLERVLRHGGLRAGVGILVAVTGIAGLVFLSNSSWGYRGAPLVGVLDRAQFRPFEEAMRPEARVVRYANDQGLEHVLWVGRGHYAGLRARVTTTSWHQHSGWAELGSHAQLLDWVREKRFDAVVLGPDVTLCQTVLCKATDLLGHPELVSGLVRLYRVTPGTLKGLRPIESGPRFTQELVTDPDLKLGAPPWGGTGSWDTDRGIMTVTSDKVFSQGVAVQEATAYRYTIRARCLSGSGRVRAQVNFLGRDGAILLPVIEVVPCTSGWTDAPMDVQSPAGATAAMVYAGAHDAGVIAEVDSVSLRR